MSQLYDGWDTDSLRICACLARHGGLVPSSAIAEETGTPRDYLIQIAQGLRDAGIVEARPGKHGGYRLAKEPGDVTALEVFDASGADFCPASLGGEAGYVLDLIIDQLRGITLEEVCHE